MRALLWDGRELRFIPDAPEPRAQPGMALLRVRLAGICSTDLQILRGYMGFRGILGHELVGEVVDGPQDLIGRRVVGEINFSCGRCATCQAGHARHCPSRTVMGILGADGAFAELVRVPVENLHRVPDEIDDRDAVFVEPIAAALRAEEQTRSFAGGRTAVLGAGKLGLLVAQVLAGRGDRVIVVTRSERSRARAEALGLIVSEARDVPRGCDLVVDATGAVEGLTLAIELVRPLGAIALKSTVADRHSIELAPTVINELTIIGSRCGAFPPALAALAERKVRVDPLVDEIVSLDRGVDAVALASAPGAGKILLDARS